jgi:hypothetical protein
MVRASWAILVTGATIATSGISARPQIWQQACVTNPDTAESARLHFLQLVTRYDSVRLADLSLPYRPAEGVSVIASEQTCGLAVAAFNQHYSDDSSTHIARALVLKVGADRYVVWGVRPRSPGGRDLYFIFDEGFSLRKVMT